MKNIKYLIIIILLPFYLSAQETRVKDTNFINWIQSINTIGLTDKWSLHLEYQLRRTEGLRVGQQNLLRLGVNYKLHENMLVQAGYAFVATYPYGDFPIASAGTFPEHRLHQQMVLKQNINKWNFTHRFRIEQRWLGKMDPLIEGKVLGWTFLHRFRYQFRAQYMLFDLFKKQSYLAVSDEIFIGAGKELGANIFDQNRLALQLGVKLNSKMNFELGYLNQILQQGRRINNQTIMQHNNGFIISSVMNF